MNLKLLFFFLFLAVLLIPAELKRKKHKHRHRHHDKGHGHGHGHGHGPGNGPEHGPGNKRGKGRETVAEILKDIFFGILASNGDGDSNDDDDDDDESISEWLFDLQEPDGQCDPNPCLNNGVCEVKGKSNYKCDCPKHFKGRKCQRGPKRCRPGKCGRGECVLTSTPPFFECKCKEPFQPPRCRHMSLCEPNPCKNGGQCVRDGNDFDCECPPGFRGRFCHVGPDDCYVDEGESYRGNVSETDDGHECLYWNSHFILEGGADPYSSYEDKEGLGPHNFCRNPDGEDMPWCFFRKGRRLSWDYCDVTECPEPTDVAPTDSSPAPTADKPQTTPQPTASKPPTTEKPSEAPQPSPTPTKVAPTSAASTAAPTIAAAGTTPAAATVAPKQFATCGKPNPKKFVTRIFGGLKVPPGTVPWQVSLQVKPKGSPQQFRHTCGGVLIASCWVLTAGHCIDNTKDMQAVVGSQTLDSDEPTEQTLNVEEVILHENYRETPSAVYNDIALLRLQGTDGVCANETQFVKTACLPDAQLPDGRECKISGWGATEDSKYGSNHLLEANVLLINQGKCSDTNVYGRVLDDSMFCAGYWQGGVDSCQGDSGGPLTCEQDKSSVIYGLVSWGDQCGKANKPGVYTRITHYLDWIKSQTNATFPQGGFV